jgi:hypothetical protein
LFPRRARRTRLPDWLTDAALIVTAVFTGGLAWFTGNL